MGTLLRQKPTLLKPAVGRRISGTLKPTAADGRDGDYFEYLGPNTNPVIALYGPKANGAWPSDPYWTSRQVPAGVNPYVVAGATGIGIPLPPGVMLTFANPSTSPGWNQEYNMAWSPGAKRGATAAQGWAAHRIWTNSFEPALTCLVSASAYVSALPNNGRMGIGLFGTGFSVGYMAFVDSSGRFGMWDFAAASAIAQSATSTAVATDYIAFSVVGAVQQVTLVSAAGVMKAQYTFVRPMVSYNTFFGIDLGVFFDSTSDTTGKMTNFIGVA